MHEELRPEQMHVAADILPLTVKDGRLQLLLSKRISPPYAGRWALPGRLVGLDESAESAARSLLKEVLPVQGAFLEQLYTFSDVSRDPRGRVISIAYLAAAPWQKARETMERCDSPLRPFRVRLDGSGLSLEGPGGLALSGSDLAFDHGRIVETGVQRLRGKVDYTDIAFRFLYDPASFSLGEVQQVFEAILDKNEDGSNFRRFLRARYEETGRIRATEQSKKSGRGRPAALYKITF